MVLATSPLLPYLGTTVSSAVLQGGVLPLPGQLGSNLGGAVDSYLQRLSISLWANNELAPIQDVVKSLISIAKNGGSVSPTSLVGIVITAIQAFVDSFKKAGEQYQANWAMTRAKYLALPGKRLFKEYPALLGAGAPGTYLFPRPGTDRWIPYPDPQSSVVPFPIQPAGFAANEFWYGEECENNVNILLDAGKQDCQAHVDYAERKCWHWPFAWPLTTPSRMAGLWSKFGDLGLEQMVVNQYLLPTALHVSVRLADVDECAKALAAVRALYYPGARDTPDGGLVLTAKDNFDNAKPTMKPRPDFSSLATAWRRVKDFYRMRELVQVNRLYWPLELQMAAQNNPDFA